MVIPGLVAPVAEQLLGIVGLIPLSPGTGMALVGVVIVSAAFPLISSLA